MDASIARHVSIDFSAKALLMMAFVPLRDVSTEGLPGVEDGRTQKTGTTGLEEAFGLESASEVEMSSVVRRGLKPPSPFGD